MKKSSALCFCIFLILLTGCASFDSRRNVSLQEKLLDNAKEAAALRGITWLIRKKDTLPEKVFISNLKKIYRTAEDEKLRKRLRKIIREKEKHLKNTELTDLNDNKYLNWFELRPIVEDLLYRKCAREDYLNDAEKIRAFLSLNWNEIFPGKMILSQKMVAAYLLKELGVCKKEFYLTVISQVRHRSRLLDDPSQNRYFLYLYALTHIIFTRSDYYGHYLEYEKFSSEIEGLNKALKTFLSYPALSDNTADILSEILICFKLLKLPPDQTILTAEHKLVLKQNPDGSWGGARESENAMTHHTVVAALALLNFRPEFRGGKIYCPLD